MTLIVIQGIVNIFLLFFIVLFIARVADRIEKIAKILARINSTLKLNRTASDEEWEGGIER